MTDEIQVFQSRYRRKRLIQQLLIIAIPLALVIAVADGALIHSKNDIGMAVWVLTLVVGLPVYLLNWRCPRCRKFLSRGSWLSLVGVLEVWSRVPQCPHCQLQLESSDALTSG